MHWLYSIMSYSIFQFIMFVLTLKMFLRFRGDFVFCLGLYCFNLTYTMLWKMESSINRLQYDQIKVKPKYFATLYIQYSFWELLQDCKSIVVFHIKTFCIIENRFCMDVASLFFSPYLLHIWSILSFLCLWKTLSVSQLYSV